MKRTFALMKRRLVQRVARVMGNAQFIVSRLLRKNKPWWLVGWNSCAAREHVIDEMRGHWPPCHVYQNISLNTSVYEWCSLIKTCSLGPANQNLICFIGVFFSVSFLVINSENESNFAWKCEDNENHEPICGNWFSSLWQSSKNRFKTWRNDWTNKNIFIEHLRQTKQPIKSNVLMIGWNFHAQLGRKIVQVKIGHENHVRLLCCDFFTKTSVS